MELQYRWTKADLEALCELQSNKMLIEQHRKILIGRVYFTTLFIILAVIVNIHLFALTIAIMVLAIISAVYYPTLIKNKWMRQLCKTYSNNKSLYGDRRLIVKETSIIAQTQDRETKLDRKSVENFIQTDSTFFLELEDGMYIVIPKTAFSTLANENKFAQIFLDS